MPPYVGEIRLFAGNFAPAGWMHCDGQILPISENETLFQLIGTTYGGDGQSTFALPNLQSRVPIHHGTHLGTTYVLAESGGTEDVTLTAQQIASHSHAVVATQASGSRNVPAGALLAQSAGPRHLTNNAPGAASLAGEAITFTGGSQPHTNQQPYLAVNFIISLFGLFPSET